MVQSIRKNVSWIKFSSKAKDNIALKRLQVFWDFMETYGNNYHVMNEKTNTTFKVDRPENLQFLLLYGNIFH